MRTIHKISGWFSYRIKRLQGNYVIYFVFLLLLLLFFQYERSLRGFMHAEGLKVTPWLVVGFLQDFSVISGTTKMAVFLGLLLIISDMNGIYGEKKYFYIRTGHMARIAGDYLYIYVVTGIYVLWIWASVLICCFPNITFSWEWGEVIQMIMSDWHVHAYYAEMVYLYKEIISGFNGITATAIQLLMLWLGGCLMGSIMYVVNIFTGKQILGICISAGTVMLCPLIYFLVAYDFADPKLFWLSPLNWSSLNSTSLVWGGNAPDVGMCLYLLALGNILILLLSIWGKAHISFEKM